MSTLRRSAGRGAIWQVLGGLTQAVVRLGASMILARVLVPEDFGLFGMALLVVELARHLSMLAMTQGLIVKKEIDDRDLCTCFWSIAGINGLLFLITFSSAPLIALMMNEPRLEEIIRWVSLIFIISTFSTIGYAILAKKLEFGKTAAIQAVGVLLESMLAVYLALNTDLGYWALIYAMLVASIYIEISILFASGWLPKFIFEKEIFRYQARFGLNGMGANITSYLSQNLDYWLVGRFMGANSLGLYEYAYRIPHLLQNNVARPVGSVLFPALARLQEDDEALMRGCMQTTRYVILVTFPMLGGLAALAEPLINVLWGDQWTSIVLPLQILCICTAIRCYTQSLGAVLLCKNKPEIAFRQSLITCICVVIFIPLGLMWGGLVGVALGMLLSTASSVYVVYHAFKLTHRPRKDMLAILYPTLFSALVSSLLAYFSYQYGAEYSDILALVGAVLAGIIGYLACYYVLFRNDFYEIGHMVIGMIRPAKDATCSQP